MNDFSLGQRIAMSGFGNITDARGHIMKSTFERWNPESERYVKRIVTSILVIAMASSLFSQTPAQEQSPPRQKIDVSKLGTQVGERVPDFTLKDQNGKL